MKLKKAYGNQSNTSMFKQVQTSLLPGRRIQWSIEKVLKENRKHNFWSRIEIGHGIETIAFSTAEADGRILHDQSHSRFYRTFLLQRDHREC